jgi:YHS domain-containing protein
MGAFDDFESRVRQRTQAEQAEVTAAQAAVEEAMRLRLDAATRLRAVAEPIQRDVVRPLMEVLGRQLEEVSVEHLTLPSGLASVAHRAHTKRFPATARLSIGAAWSEESGMLWLAADQAFMPILLPLDHTSQLQVEPARPNADAIRSWVEECILGFVDACIEIERSPAYAQAPRHVDPVCGMIVAAEPTALVVELEGRRYYFCSAACRDRFAAEPQAYTADRRGARGAGTRGGAL